FTYLTPSPVDENDIYITEFMYNPPSGQTEYIELYNASNKSLNLQGWILNDNSGDPSLITINQFIIPPKSYIVLYPIKTLLEKYTDINLIEMGRRFPSFNNSGDDIIIHNADSLKLDSLRYMSDWGGSKIALERRSVGAPALQPNFADAPNGLGTPGSKNQIEKDTTPPKLRYVN